METKLTLIIKREGYVDPTEIHDLMQSVIEPLLHRDCLTSAEFEIVENRAIERT